MDLTEISFREGYTLYDWFSDIGGIQSILISIIAIFVSTWNYRYMDNFLVSKLFKLKLKNQNKLVPLKISASSGLKDFFCDKLPSCF